MAAVVRRGANRLLPMNLFKTNTTPPQTYRSFRLLEIQLGSDHVVVMAFADERKLPYCGQFSDFLLLQGETLRIGQDDLRDYFSNSAGPPIGGSMI